jgi:hypothetical protein
VQKPSDWNLNLADWLRPRFNTARIAVDGKSIGAVTGETTSIAFAAGSQSHTIGLGGG